MFSQTAEYALRALTYLAQTYPAPQTTAVIAEHTQVPAGYLSKVLQQLGRARFVTAARGKHGGWEMAKPPNTISILDIVNVMDPIRRIDSCPLRLQAHSVMLCPLHKKMDQALELIERTLASSTLAELLDTPGMPVPLCNAITEVRQ
ncbi:MAG: Rrf2 family transcriptional regulator [Bryobacterales bacterium]|nr:Rrf2 family transcriptional regulator [Bryobacterales bacterium]